MYCPSSGGAVPNAAGCGWVLIGQPMTFLWPRLAIRGPFPIAIDRYLESNWATRYKNPCRPAGNSFATATCLQAVIVAELQERYSPVARRGRYFDQWHQTWSACNGLSDLRKDKGRLCLNGLAPITMPPPITPELE